MEDDPETLRARLERLAELAELARQASPADRTRLERTLEMVSRALQAVTQARQDAQRAARLREEAEAIAARRRIEHAALETELRIIGEEIRARAELRIPNNHSSKWRAFP
jgi:hypothetical protein